MDPNQNPNPLQPAQVPQPQLPPPPQQLPPQPPVQPAPYPQQAPLPPHSAQQPLPQQPQLQPQPLPQPPQPQVSPPEQPEPAPDPAPDEPEKGYDGVFGPAAPPPPDDFDPSKSPTQQLDHHDPETILPPGGDRQDAKHVTRLPLNVPGGPLPALIIGGVILLFLIAILLYAFTSNTPN